MRTQVFRGIIYTVETTASNGKTIQGTQENDWIEAPGTNNVISTDKGNDVILAGVTPSSQNPVSDAPPYKVLYGGQYIVTDAASPPTVGNTAIDAGTGDDYVVVGKENYTVDLGNGNNIFDGSHTSDVDSQGGFIFRNIRVSAGSGNDIIDAGAGNYQIDAGGGNNWIYLTAGNVSVSAGSGNDVITTNSAGGLGVLFTYLTSEQPGQPYKQVIDAGNGDNQIELPVLGQTSITTGSGQDFVLAASVSPLIGGEVNSDSVDILTGSGNDTVIAIDTKSLIKTGAGDDLIVAGAGDDTIYAGSGRNVINLRGGTFSIPSPLDDLGFFGSEASVQGGGDDTVYLESGRDTVVLGSDGTATIYGFDRNDLLDVSGLSATFTRNGNDTLIKAGSIPLGVLKGYTGSVSLV